MCEIEENIHSIKEKIICFMKRAGCLRHSALFVIITKLFEYKWLGYPFKEGFRGTD